MTRALKAGHLQKMSEQAANKPQEFAREFFQISQRYTEQNSVSTTIALGEEAITLAVDDKTPIGALIREAFITSEKPSTFTLQIWDSSQGDALPDLSWAKDYLFQDIVVPRSVSGALRIAFDKSQGFIYVYDPTTNFGSIWMRDHSLLAYASFITPFRLMMSWMANNFSGEIIHASAIGVGDRGVLINGPSGSGKSTLGLHAALKGYPVLADDVALLSKSKIYSVYSRAKAQSSSTPLSLKNLATFEIADMTNGKTVIPFNNFGEKFLRSIDLRVLVLPIFAHLSHYEKLQPGVALKLLAPNSLRELFGGSPENFLRLSQLTKTTPAYRLALSEDSERNFENLLRIVEQS
ncbi:MAG: hypothetical protein WDO06_01710 [Actinomycetota bacterium]